MTFPFAGLALRAGLAWVLVDQSSGRCPRGGGGAGVGPRVGISPRRTFLNASAGGGIALWNIRALAREGWRSAGRTRRLRTIDLLVAWASIACQPVRCRLIPCCYVTAI